MRLRRNVTRWIFCLAGSALGTGCGVYLHDDNLQKQTDALLATYKTADVAGAVKASIAAQLDLDKLELQAVVDNDTAERDRAIADLIASYPVYGTGLAIARLDKRVSDRIAELVGNADRIEFAAWQGMHEKRIQDEALVDAMRRALVWLQRRYAAAGGKDFTSCDTFAGAGSGADADLVTAGRQLKAQCGILQALTQPTDAMKRALDKVFAADGEIGRAHRDLLATTEQIVGVTQAREEALKALGDAQDALKGAGAGTRIDADVEKKLKELSDALSKVDTAAGALGGGDASLGNALAAIQFRKTNLRDVLAASTGEGATGPTTDVKRAIVGVVAGVITLSETRKAPSVPALSIALAYQDGLEKAAYARLDALTQRRALLSDQENALVHELELLAVARQAIADSKDGLSSGACSPRGFVDVFQNASCPGASRAAGARALTAYYLSWASGRTAARLADRKITHLITWQGLRTSQEAAVARVNIQSIALNQLAAYGQGGIKPETIAAFLQAFGIAAIAKGVN